MVATIFLRTVQISGFILTQITNSFLIFLIIFKASKNFGSYKNLMLAYALYSMIYSCIEILTQPITHTKGSGFILYVDSFLKYNTWIGNILAMLFCASFSFCISLLAMHFFYRYLAVCHPASLQHLEGVYILRLFVPPMILSTIWYLGCYFCLTPTEYKTEYMRDQVLEIYEDDTRLLAYIEVLYFFEDEFGNKTISYLDWIAGFAICVGIMNLCLSTIIFCGYKTYKVMNSVKSTLSIMSKRTRDLNKQLFRTLIVQTLVPVCTMFIPVGLLLVLPAFSIELGSLSNAPAMYAGLYPALDAMIVILMINDFRNFVFCRKRRGVMNVTTIGSSSNVL